MVNKVHFSSSRSSQPRLFTTAPSRVPRWRSGKTSAGQCRSYKIPGFDSWVGKIPWSRKWQPTLQYSCLENSMDRGAWRATVHGITESDSTEHTHTHTHIHIFCSRPKMRNQAYHGKQGPFLILKDLTA